MFCLYLTVLLVVASINAYEIPAPFDIRIDYYKVDTTRDLVINTPLPRFSWKLPRFNERNVRQTAYQIQLQSYNDRWDSGKVDSTQSIHVSNENFDGLLSLTYYQIRFRVWTSLSDEASSWTDWIRFRTSMFDLHEFLMQRNDDVNWIGSTQIYMNELRKEFNVSSTSAIRTAIAFISGVGYYELYING
ncbi:unnamed protein product, partial [Adineta ricciae]